MCSWAVNLEPITTFELNLELRKCVYKVGILCQKVSCNEYIYFVLQCQWTNWVYGVAFPSVMSVIYPFS